MSRTNSNGLFNSYDVSVAYCFSLDSFMRHGRSTTSHTIWVIGKTLEALIHRFCHHEQSIFWSLKINYVRLALVLSSFISKLLGRLRSCICMNLDFSRHEVKHIIYLVQHFSSTSFQRQLVLIIVPLNFVETTLHIVFLDFKRHFLGLVESNVELAQRGHTFWRLLRNASLHCQLMQFESIHFLSLRRSTSGLGEMGLFGIILVVRILLFELWFGFRFNIRTTSCSWFNHLATKWAQRSLEILRFHLLLH